MNELLKMSKGNKKLKKTLIFDLPSGHTCPMANECKSYVVMNANGKTSLKDGENTILDVSLLVKKISILTYIKQENII